MAKKDFSQVNTGRVYDTITEATAEPETVETIKAQEEQEQNTVNVTHDKQGTKQKRGPRRTYTEAEAAEIKQTGKTTGKKGVKMDRINMAFAPDLYDFIQVMSRVTGQSMTDFVNLIVRKYMNDHRELYDKAIEFRNSL